MLRCISTNRPCNNYSCFYDKCYFGGIPTDDKLNTQLTFEERTFEDMPYIKNARSDNFRPKIDAREVFFDVICDSDTFYWVLCCAAAALECGFKFNIGLNKDGTSLGFAFSQGTDKYYGCYGGDRDKLYADFTQLIGDLEEAEPALSAAIRRAVTAYKGRQA